MKYTHTRWLTNSGVLLAFTDTEGRLILERDTWIFEDLPELLQIVNDAWREHHGGKEFDD